MSSETKSLGSTAGLATLLLSIAAAPASAQVLEEIVVTAKQREQSLQDVPLSIAVLSESELERARITELRALAEFTPNLVFTPGQGRLAPSTLAIRGIAPNTGDIQRQGVSVFLDGVYVGGAVQSLDLTQLERVEVLRGPQSSTFGRQTYAGALNYVTKTPNVDELTGVVKANYSSNRGAAEDNWQISGNLQLPLIADGMWLELGGTKKIVGEMSRNGSRVARNTANESFREVRVGREATEAFTGALFIQPTDNLSIKLRGIISKDRDGPSLTVATQPQEWVDRGLTVVNRGAGIVSSTDPGFDWPQGKIFAPSPSAVSCDSVSGRPSSCGVDRDRAFFSSNISYTLDSGHELSYLAGWAADTRWSNADLYLRGASPDPFFGAAYSRLSMGNLLDSKLSNPFFSAQKQRYENQSHELRILSPVGERLTWRAGLYYFSEKERFGVASLQASQPNNSKGIFQGPQFVKNYAIFGGATWEFNDQWSIEAEGRFQREADTLGPCFSGRCQEAATANNVREFSTTEKNNQFLPRVTLMFRPVEDVMLYTLFSQGTKAARYNVSQQTDFAYVDPEKLTNYEIGAKTDWLDGRISVNGAAFLIKVKDQQFSTVRAVEGGGSQTLFQNIGRSESKGFELDTRLLVTEQWTAAAGIAYAKQEYTNDFEPTDANLRRLFNGEGFKGKSGMSLPEWTGFVSTQYVQPVDADLDLVLDGSLTYRGESYADQANLTKVPAITRVNLRAALDSSRWEVALFVRDLFDNNDPVSGLTNPTNVCLYFEPAVEGGSNYGATQRCLAVVLDRGREIGASVTYRF